jgi:hypothetical protein
VWLSEEENVLPIILAMQGAELVASMFHKKPAASEPLLTETPNDPSSSDTATLSASSATAAPTMLSQAEGGLDVAASALSEFPLPLSPTATSMSGAYTLSRALYPNRPADTGFVGLPQALDLSSSLTDQSTGSYD